MRKGYWTVLAVITVAILAGAAVYLYLTPSKRELTVLISPYQDLAMLVNIEPLGLEDKYDVPVKLLTIPWEEMYPTILSANSPADVAFAGYADYLTKRRNLNANSDDPLLFVLPAYIFKGGAFVAMRPDISPITKSDLENQQAIRDFLSLRIGLPKNTLYEMLLAFLAERAGVQGAAVKITDVGFDVGFLAVQHGDLDIAAVGLTQLTEAKRLGGRSVLDMETLGVADLTGFIVKASTLKERRSEVEALIRMWFDSVDYVLSDIDKNSVHSLSYLREHAATHYTVDTYQAALSQEYFPRSLAELNSQVLQSGGRFSADVIHQVIVAFLRREQSEVSFETEPRFELESMAK
jgi:ABC-type nitrate/sulfonate/bicarbonate transport system substrate-binding protein